MTEKAGDKKLFAKHRNIWICGYQSHKKKNKIRLIRFILDKSRMEDVKGRDDDSSDSSYSGISQVSKPSSQKKVLALKNQ